ncbi:MAG TPA: TlyA family RNA methyltransferase [Candidatus Obscuribacterales bacterium]
MSTRHRPRVLARSTDAMASAGTNRRVSGRRCSGARTISLMPKGPRLDVRVMELGLFNSREAAQAAIIDGGVLVDGQPITKPGSPVPPQAIITIAPGWGAPKYVGRGGLKLEKALETFAVDPSGRVCLDIGASTGGFTDCLLKHGARRVYAVDVGYGQLDWALRNDPRVVVKERINARHLTPGILYANGDEWANLVTIDVSFISIAKIFCACLAVTRLPELDLVCLIKPQFEAGREQVGKGGVVKSPAVHVQVIESLVATADNLGLHAHHLTFSPITGPAGNIEYLMHWRTDTPRQSPATEAVVEEAHRVLCAI